MGESIIGQAEVVERLLIGLLANGNLLVEGLPGLAKTRAIKSLAKNLEATEQEIVSAMHPHPTISEAIMEAAGVAVGKAIHL